MIDKENFEKASFEENQKFIKEILRLATHNAFTKEDLLLCGKGVLYITKNFNKECDCIAFKQGNTSRKKARDILIQNIKELVRE